jgi:hypothetical protein
MRRSLGDGGSVLLGSNISWVAGLVRNVDRSSFTLTPCDGAACGGNSWTVTIDAVGLDLRGTLTAGNYVRVHTAPGLQNPDTTREILVTDLLLAPTLSGTTVESLYVAANVSSNYILEAPFTVSYERAACPDTVDCADAAPGGTFDRALTMSVPMGNAGTLQAAMGQTAQLYGTNGRLTLRNLRSVETRSCYRNGTTSIDTSYWITNQPYRE